MQVPPETRCCLPWEGHEVVEIGQLFPAGWGWNQGAHLHPVGKGSGAVIHQIQVSSFPFLHLSSPRKRELSSPKKSSNLPWVS